MFRSRTSAPARPDRKTEGRAAASASRPTAGFRRRLGRVALLFFVGLSLAAPMRFAAAKQELRGSTSDVVRVADLPREGRMVLDEIHAGGPFASKRDGIVFGNREGFLPRQRRGYYAEYTVPTPGAATRGARRIIAGRGTTGDFRTSNEYYYTNDHYQSFRRIVQ